MFREKVIVMDAIIAVHLMEESLKVGKSKLNNIHSMAPDNNAADAEYNATGIQSSVFIFHW